LERLTKQYRAHAPAVDGLDLDVAPGEFVTLLGPSGSGKTTSLMMVAGFVPPTSGTVWIGDQDVTRLQAHKRNLGMVFQHYALFPHLSVHDNIAFPLKMRRVRSAKVSQRVDDVLELVDLPGHGARRPAELSGGQQQRVALARALVYEPPVLLMDEPLGALDKQLRERMQLEIKRIQRRLGVTVLYVTHDQEEALTMSDRIVVLRDGGVEQTGSPEKVYEEPRNAFVATFLGESNLLGGVVVDRGSGVARVEMSSGMTFLAAGSDLPPSGTRVRTSIRPERMVIVAPDADDPQQHDNRWPCKVDEVIYAGDAVKYRVIHGSQPLTVKDRISRAARLKPGDSVGIAWRSCDTRILGDALAEGAR
jgi:spermidine/putrescine ABC transporter ATP-binding subunit